MLALFFNCLHWICLLPLHRFVLKSFFLFIYILFLSRCLSMICILALVLIQTNIYLINKLAFNYRFNSLKLLRTSCVRSSIQFAYIEIVNLILIHCIKLAINFRINHLIVSHCGSISTKHHCTFRNSILL